MRLYGTWLLLVRLVYRPVCGPSHSPATKYYQAIRCKCDTTLFHNRSLFLTAYHVGRQGRPSALKGHRIKDRIFIYCCLFLSLRDFIHNVHCKHV